ncbi:cardiolipin synthase 1 [Bacteroidales bacterium]|nr:cardiolipin synthase 1 [Bacteroidales bacterium]
METTDILLYIFQAIYLITAGGIFFLVISENRNPLKTISWALLLVLFPVGGILIYYFFGQDTRKIRIISRKSYKKIKKQSFDKLIAEDIKSISPNYLPLAKLLNNNNDASLLEGSSVKVFTNGKDKFEALLKDLEQAKKHIHLQYYIFMDDAIGHIVKQKLIQKAAQGIEVCVLYDDVANWKVRNKFYDEMRDAGINITSYLEVRFPIFTSKVNYRNHRKIVVIDGLIGYVGGMNIADRYLKPDWRDTHLRIVGKGVYGLQAAFLVDWHASHEDIEITQDHFPPCVSQTDNLMQIATGGPIRVWRTLLQATIQIILNAKKYIYIQTPYFLPTEALLQSLQTAALAGVDVRLMMPESSDVQAVNTASQSYFEDVLLSGVKIYTLKSSFLHAKTLITDDYLSVVGSANMDFRSFEHNFEVNAYIYEKEFALQMKRIFLEDQKQCNIIGLRKWQQRPKLQKLKESFMRMFSPLL